MSNEKSTQDRETGTVVEPDRELSEDELAAVAGGIGLAVAAPPDPCIGLAADKTVHVQPFNITKKLDKSTP